MVFPAARQFSTGQEWVQKMAADAGMAIESGQTMINLPRHPSQLYESALEGFVLFALLWWYSAKPRPYMAVSGLFLLLYGLFRFFVEFYRVPDAHLSYLALGWVTMGQILSVPMIVVGAIMLFMAYRKNQETGH